jgi:hypothetical protein
LLSLLHLRAFALLIFAFLIAPAAASAQSSGGSVYVAPPPAKAGNLTVPGTKAKLLPDSTAAAPANAPRAVQEAIWAANRLQNKPYKYGGGHAKVEDSGYDCSGTVSYALIHANLLDSPLPSGPFTRWGAKGRGKWITVFAHGGHAYAIIAGLRLDTSVGSYSARRASKRKIARSAFERGPRWRPMRRSSRGFIKRHPVGL